MTFDRLRNTWRAQPFRPFRRRTGDGRSLRVSRPGFVWIPPEDSRTVIVSTGGDGFKIIDMMRVTSIEVGNGTGRHKR